MRYIYHVYLTNIENVKNYLKSNNFMIIDYTLSMIYIITYEYISI